MSSSYVVFSQYRPCDIVPFIVLYFMCTYDKSPWQEVSISLFWPNGFVLIKNAFPAN